MSVKWDKFGAIAGLIAIPLAALAIFVQVTTPEIRCRIGLGCSPEASSSPAPTPKNPSQSPLVTPGTQGSSRIPTPSDVDANYNRLQDLLASKRFKEADQETTRLMLWIAGREKEGYLVSGDVKDFPCTDLNTIDQLWVKYSNGKFGFGVQNRIWQEVGREPNNFEERVGWQMAKGEYNNLLFDLRAPLGGLPAVSKGEKDFWLTTASLFSRTEACMQHSLGFMRDRDFL